MDNIKLNVPHILGLNTKAKREFLDSFDLVFFDCDGVIWLVVGAIPHTNDAINLLKDAGKSCKFVSNNSVRSETEYLQKFQKIGVRDVIISDIIHPARSMINYINIHYPENVRIFSLCSTTSNELFKKNCINVLTLEYGKLYTPASLLEILRANSEKVDVVLYDINLDLNFVQLACAHQHLKHSDCELIVGGMDPLIPLAQDISLIGFSNFLPFLTKDRTKENVVLGKPGIALGNLVKELFNIVEPKRCLFVGDSFESDIAFGKNCGFQTLLVLTGVATKESMITAPNELRPDYYADGLVDFIEFFKNLKQTTIERKIE